MERINILTTKRRHLPKNCPKKMKKQKIMLFMVFLMSAGMGNAYAQYYRFDPFAGGEKMIGVDVGTGFWLGNSDVKIIDNDYGAYSGYVAESLKRPPFNPTVAFVYRRTLDNGNVNWGNTYRIAFNWWQGTVEGVSTSNPNKAFSTDFKYRNIEITDLYYIMIPIGDQFSINAGGGLSIGLNMSPHSTIIYSDGTPSVKTEGGLAFMDMLSAQIDLVVGADYLINDNITLSANFIGYAFDFFGLLAEGEEKGFRGVGEGLFVSKKFPAQFTVGVAFHL